MSLYLCSFAADTTRDFPARGPIEAAAPGDSRDGLVRRDATLYAALSPGLAATYASGVRRFV